MFMTNNNHNLRNIAIFGSFYVLIQSIFIIIIYVWRITEHSKDYKPSLDVYYGILIAYYFLISIHFALSTLSLFCLHGISEENAAFLIPWVLGLITSMALEALTITYSNVLRNHVNKIVMVTAVMQFLNLINSGFSWKHSELIEL